MLLARHCGLRMSSIMRLAPCHVSGGIICVPAKGSAWTQVPISPAVAEALKGLAQLCASPTIPIMEQLGLRHGYQVSRRITAAQKLAGCRGCWTVHDMRRTFARHLYDATGHDLRVVQSAMAHTSPVYTLHYLCDPETRATAEQIALAAPEKRTA
jgi:integrase